MKENAIIGGLAVVLVALTFGAGFLAAWYQAGVQQSVYARQGVQMSRWEVFIGAKPVERYVVPGKE